MKIEELAVRVFGIVEETGAPYMAVGAVAVGTYGIPRATKDLDLLVETTGGASIPRLMEALDDLVAFDPQVRFDTITWGKRWIGSAKTGTPYQVELFETFDDPFVEAQFARRTKRFVPILNLEIWLPTPEDLVIQKLRWARPKDLDDARDVLAVQQPENLDMDYVESWCAQHGSAPRLREILDALGDF